MTPAAQLQLIPIQEMSPAEAVAIRNSVIEQLLAYAAKELRKSPDELIVRDIEPYTDLEWDYAAATASGRPAYEHWEYDITTTSVGYKSFTGDTNMADQRFVAIFGIRDARLGIGATGTATAQGGLAKPHQLMSLIKFTVGGSIAAIWDITGLSAYHFDQAALCPAAIVIPQNVQFNIYGYTRNMNDTKATGEVGTLWLQLVGVVVEPRGKVVTP